MYYQLGETSRADLLKLPENRPGCHIVAAKRVGEYEWKKYVIFNASLVFEGDEAINSFREGNLPEVTAETETIWFSEMSGDVDEII
jgi:hypothetical protein